MLRCQRGSSGEPPQQVHAEIVLGCDGVNSTVRRSLHPADELVHSGVNAWRGVTRYPPILGRRSYMLVDGTYNAD